MARRMLPPIASLAPLVVLSLLTVGSGTDSAYVDEQDRRAAADAAESVADLCRGGVRGEVDRAAGRRRLERAIGDRNLLQEALGSSESWSEVADRLRESMTPMWLAQRFAPITCALLVVLLWSMLCWTACCRCCRCCAKHRPVSCGLKTALLILLCALLMGVVVAAAISLSGIRSAQAGAENMACTSAKLLDATLSGQQATNFVGMVPLLTTVQGLEEQLADGSPFLRQVQGVLDSTVQVERAVALASATLTLLSNAMEDPANRRPSQGGQDLLHVCHFCEQLPPILRPAVSALDSGAGKALADARAEVDSQLTPERRADLQSALREAAQPLVDVKTAIRDSLYFIVDGRSYEKVKPYVSGSMPPLFMVVLSLVVACALLVSCGCCTSACWLCCEKNSRAQRLENPYRRRVHRCACLSWCCGFLYAFLALLVGGLLVVLMAAMSGACLLMDDLGSPLVHDVAPLMKLNMSGDQGVMISGIVDGCFGRNPTANSSNLLELVFTRKNGSRVSVRSQIVGSLRDQVQARFDEVSQRMAVLSSLSLANSSQVAMLRASVRDHPVDAMLIADGQQMRSDPLYTGLLMDPRGDNGVAIGLAASAACANTSISPSMNSQSFALQTVPGIDAFMEKLKFFGTEQPGSTCALQVLCRSTLSPQEAAACAAGNNYVALKNRLLSATTFRCDLFEFENGTACDPLHMVRVNGAWLNDCVRSDGSLRTKQLTCDLQSFVQYVADFDARVDTAFRRLDDAVAGVRRAIDVDLRRLVDRSVVQPISGIADGLTCGFLGTTYHEMVDGLCYQSVLGLWTVGWAYTACGVLAMVFVGLLYCTWRRALDNCVEWRALDFGRMDEEYGGVEMASKAPGIVVVGAAGAAGAAGAPPWRPHGAHGIVVAGNLRNLNGVAI